MKMLKHLTANEIKLQPFPFKRELSMEAYLIENEAVLLLDDDAFSDVSIIDEQFSIKKGIPRGIIDMLISYPPEYIGIVELKLGELNEAALKQLERYLENGKEQILAAHTDIISKDVSTEPKWIGVLAGSSIDPQLADKISGGYTASGVPIAALTISRFRGDDGNIYVTTETYFKNNLSSKDYSKYKFNGQEYGKARLVLAVIKQYVEDNPSINFSALRETFPKILHGSWHVFVTRETAEGIFNKKNRKRNFLNADELITLSDDSVIAVSTQWGKKNIKEFIKKAKELNYKITKKT